MKKIKINKKVKNGKKYSVEAEADGRKIKLFFQRDRDNLNDEKIKKIIEGLK